MQPPSLCETNFLIFNHMTADQLQHRITILTTGYPSFTFYDLLMLWIGYFLCSYIYKQIAECKCLTYVVFIAMPTTTGRVPAYACWWTRNFTCVPVLLPDQWSCTKLEMPSYTTDSSHIVLWMAFIDQGEFEQYWHWLVIEFHTLIQFYAKMAVSTWTIFETSLLNIVVLRWQINNLTMKYLSYINCLISLVAQLLTAKLDIKYCMKSTIMLQKIMQRAVV